MMIIIMSNVIIQIIIRMRSSLIHNNVTVLTYVPFAFNACIFVDVCVSCIKTIYLLNRDERVGR